MTVCPVHLEAIGPAWSTVRSAVAQTPGPRELDDDLTMTTLGWGAPSYAVEEAGTNGADGHANDSNGNANGRNGYPSGTDDHENDQGDKDIVDTRMSDVGSGLISNDFQVEVSAGRRLEAGRSFGVGRARTHDHSQVKLADLQADPNSPLYSVKKFEQLPM